MVLADSDGNHWVVVEKVPVVGDESLTRDATYPRITLVPCEAEPELAEGRVAVTLLHGIEAEGGQTRFVVKSSSVVRGQLSDAHMGADPRTDRSAGVQPKRTGLSVDRVAV